MKELVSHWSVQTKGTKKKLQRLIGKLNWCARVIHGGRSFIRNLINLTIRLKQPHHRVWMSAKAKADIQWWVVALDLFHGTTQFNCDAPLPSHEFSTDACLTGGGAHYLTEWFHVNWQEDFPEFVGAHINVLELKSVEIAAELWGERWRGSHILLRSDNSATVSAVNKGTSRSCEMLQMAKSLFWLSVKHGFKLSAVHIPGILNVLSDHLSRLNEYDAAIKANDWLTGGLNFDVECCGRMSYGTYCCLQEYWGQM